MLLLASYNWAVPALTANEQTLVDTVKKEIPLDRKGHPRLDYIIDRQKSKQLALDPIEDGYDSLQIRIWFDYSMARKKHLVVIKRHDGKWSCQLFITTTKWNDANDSQIVVNKSVLPIEPSMGWAHFIKRLLDLDIMNLPNGPPGGMDGANYNVEIATEKLYRYYSYWSPDSSEKEFKGSRNMVEIISFLEKVCDFKTLQ